MIYNIQNVKKAREMRLSGNSLSEIHKETSISISTLSNWLRDITLTKEQLIELEQRVKPKMSRGRMNSSISLRSKRLITEKKIYEESEKDFVYLLQDQFFILGLALYWAHGSKKGCFQFASSDKNMISIMGKWIKKYFRIEERIIKVRNYNNHLRIDISRIDVLRKIIAWQKLLIQYYSDVVV